ncbi:MAG: glycosyltransferase [Oscillospiraceae bacterium]
MSTEQLNEDKSIEGNTPIRVLHCVAGLGRGGYETFIMNVYRHIDRTKVQFDFLYSFDGVFNDEILSLGGRLFQIPFITKVGPFAYRRSVMDFFRQHNEYKIVHSHMDKFSGLIVECGKKSGIPIRIAHSHSIKNEGGRVYQSVKNYYGKKIESNCTHKFACSKEASQWLFGKDAQSIVIKNGIDLSKFTNLDNRDKQVFTIVSIARFSQPKNHDFLIDIFSEVYKKDKTARLILAGTGALQNSIKKKVKDMGLEIAVTFLNDCDNIPQLLSTADVMCMPSLFEGLGIALIEGQASGIPCVASDVIPREVQVSQDICFISLHNTADMWANEILKYKGCRRKNNSKEIAEKGYDISSSSDFLQSFYIENGSI